MNAARTLCVPKRNRRRLIVGAASLVVLLSVAGSALASHYIWRNGNQLHWIRDGTAVAQVYFVDYTGSRWPVNASTIEWNRSSRLGAYYLSPSNNCPFHCVGVKADYFGTDDARGWAVLSWDSNGHLTGQTYVRLNKSYAANATKDRAVTCQELGHTIGLDHQGSSSTSCMNGSGTDFNRYPNQHDYDLLFNLYDH
jgi:hypothetical protein